MFKKRLVSCMFLLVLIWSCAPSFDLKKENLNIINSLQKLSSPEKRVDIFYPTSYDTDSIKKILAKNKNLLNVISKMKKYSDAKINRVSSSVTIQGKSFKIVNAVETFKLKINMLNKEEIKRTLNNNLVDYVEEGENLTITDDSDFIAIYHNNKWEYFDFNIPIMYDAYGLKDTKKLVQLYYDEVFEPAKEKWDVESIQDFKNMYNKNKNLPQYKNLDFEAYCDCILLHHEKLDHTKDIPEGFFESVTHLNYIYSCRILTSHE